MGNLSQEYKGEIQEIFGEIYAKYIREELQATVDSEVAAKLKATADGISKQAEQAIRKEVERLSSKLKKGITDALRAELLDMIKDAVPKERKELDYEKMTQMITKILDERKEGESGAAFADPRIQAGEKSTRSDNKITRGLLIASLLLNILLLAIVLYKMIFESWIPFF
jgi:post-segregation antitoxin (ccd killing protein)